MFDQARAELERDATDLLLPENVRTMARAALNSLEAYTRVRIAEARRPTDPAGHALVKPKAGG